MEEADGFTRDLNRFFGYEDCSELEFVFVEEDGEELRFKFRLRVHFIGSS